MDSSFIVLFSLTFFYLFVVLLVHLCKSCPLWFLKGQYTQCASCMCLEFLYYYYFSSLFLSSARSQDSGDCFLTLLSLQIHGVSVDLFLRGHDLSIHSGDIYHFNPHIRDLYFEWTEAPTSLIFVLFLIFNYFLYEPIRLLFCIHVSSR